MQLLVRIFSGKTIVLDVEETYTILQIKELIYDREMIPIHLQKLMLNTKYLENSKTLKEYHMVHEMFIHLV
jgi:ubiquitin C